MPEVKDLRRKLKTLYVHGPFKDLSGVAASFELSVGALNSWVDGKNGANKNVVPNLHYPLLVGLFQQALPGMRSEQDVRQLLEAATAHPLEDAFLSGAGVLLSDLVANEGRTDTSSIERSPRWKGTLVEHDDPDEPESTLPRVALGERFSIVYSLGQTNGHLLVLQNVQQLWGIVKFGDKSVTKEIRTSRFVFPGANANGRPVRLCENRDTGLSRFVCFVSPLPFPVLISESAGNSVALDKSGLDTLAKFYRDLPKSQRAIHLFEVIVVGRK